MILSMILYDLFQSWLGFHSLIDKMLLSRTQSCLPSKMLSRSKSILRSHSILIKINNDFMAFSEDLVRSDRILYDSTVENFTECCGVLSYLSKIPYPSLRILYDLIGFSTILSDPVGFHMIFSIILYDLFKNHLKFHRISVGSCAIA